MDGLWKRLPVVAASLGLAVGLAIGVTALAGAATTRLPAQESPDPSTTQPPAANPTQPAPAAPAPGAPGPGPGFGFEGHGRGGFGPGIHGEFTVPGPNGGYETLASQIGQVTAVSPTSLKVKSEDGFERTYAVDDGTVVTAGRDGIANVKDGDTVHVLAVVTNGNAKAVEIGDHTQVESRRGAWAPQRPAKPAGAKPASANGTA